MADARDRNERGWRRSSVPTLSWLLSLMLAIVLLPSAFTSPQSEPSVTLEYAPVPPSDDDPPPDQDSNVSSLGLSESVTAPQGTGEGEGTGGTGGGLPPDPPPGTAERPVTKRCVGSPPRQTEDPLAPPCVAHFEGDNFGATYRGVDADEVRILFYLEGGPCATGTSNGNLDCAPIDETFDLAEPPERGEHIDLKLLRAMQAYFNDRYQTYNRRVRFIVHFDQQPNDNPPEVRRADASALLAEWDPFAALAYPRGNEAAFMEAVAGEGVLVFGSQQQREAAFYRAHEPLVWSFQPAIEQQAEAYVTHLCRQVIPYPVSMSGNLGENGQPRRLGLIWADDPRRPGYARFAEVVKAGVEACGGEFVAEATYPVVGTNQGRDGETNEGIADQNIAQMRSNGVTTIIWPQGYEIWHTRAAAIARYYPEWFKAGDRQLEGQGPGSFQDRVVYDGHVITATTLTFSPDLSRDFCFNAFGEGDPNMHPTDKRYGCQIRSYYDDLRQLFTGIQVAGPRLTPETVDQGFHAIPAVSSSDPRVPACFYRVGDYSCVKDAMLVWWGSTPTDPSTCWRVMSGAQRYRAADWPEVDAVTMRDPTNDPCLGFEGAVHR